MTIQGIYEELVKCQAKLDEAGIDDLAKIDLDILASQLRKQILFKAFDPLKELDHLTVADVSSLPGLVAQVGAEVRSEQKRVALVNQITSVAKMALKAAGLPLPS